MIKNYIGKPHVSATDALGHYWHFVVFVNNHCVTKPVPNRYWDLPTMNELARPYIARILRRSRIASQKHCGIHKRNYWHYRVRCPKCNRRICQIDAYCCEACWKLIREEKDVS